MPKASILIVEEDRIIAMDIQNSLKNLGYFIAGQTDQGEEAVKNAQELHPDLILMDIDLKGDMDGIEAAAQIRARVDLPVIFLMAFANQSTLERARQSEPYGYVFKPFEEHELAIAIEMALYKHSMEKKLRESEERYDLAVRGANDGLWDWNLKKNEIYYSPRWKAMLGFKEEEIGSNPEEWLTRLHPDDRKQVQENLVSHIKGNTPHFESEYRIQHANGSYVWVLSRGLAVRDAEGKAYRMAGSQADITARKLVEEQLAYSALHDVLTGLPNRVLFMDRLRHRLEQTKRHPDHLFAVLFIDLDRFKIVNDSLGHAIGDQLLIATAQRLQQCVRPEDTVSRLGGDEFSILLNEVHEANDAIRVAERIEGRLVSTSMLDAVKRSTTASIGITLFNPNNTNPEDYLRDADTAMYRAKALGGNRHQLFDSAMYANAVALLEMEGELRHAVERQELLVEYQPIISLASGKATGVEALVRWLQPEGRVIHPLEFISVAEDTGLIIPIGEFVLRTSCLQAKAWRDAGLSKLWVSVNLSARQFQDQHLVRKIERILLETGLPSDGLRLEVTESTAMRDLAYSIKILKDLNKLGVHVSLDDFGNGYSSLSYLKRFPLKVLKIDRSFIQDIMVNKNSEAITTAIIVMARSLNLEVVAEGVETEKQLAFVKSKFCDEVQGFLFSKPLPAKELTSLLQKRRNFLIAP
jgi:diguanylate cyclase (GGDEF)-like protein/PAS domain S-box-containing protein